ncbi:MAG TPA: secondary thiamine-phosphate synthase enzyme YjbQ [Polyangiaceae bacterium]|nr:secondary thiamine-phosphate synthase enzyme YjbQ [Polyangiaceae bacterium]
MPVFRRRFELETRAHNEVIDLTDKVRAVVAESGVSDGICTVFTPHATAAIAINENDDPNIGVDLLRALTTIVVEHDGWLHDRIDDNAAAHIKSAILGPSETIPIENGRLALGTWQNVFFVELDGPRSRRGIVVVVVG